MTNLKKTILKAETGLDVPVVIKLFLSALFIRVIPCDHASVLYMSVALYS